MTHLFLKRFFISYFFSIKAKFKQNLLANFRLNTYHCTTLCSNFEHFFHVSTNQISYACMLVFRPDGR